jgi:hypothetical protein
MAETWILVEGKGRKQALKASAVEHVELLTGSDGTSEVVSIQMVSGERHIVAENFGEVLRAIEGSHAPPLTAIR